MTSAARPRFAFFGTPEIAVPSLEAVHALGEIAMVVAQPDRPRGRGQKVEAPPTKVRALELGIPVTQPIKLKDGALAAQLKALELDAAVVIAYGRILPKDVLSAPRLGCVNVHASLLPRWRGAAPIQWAVASGDAESGVCLMEMDVGLDTGPVFARVATPIDPSETAGELASRIGPLGASILRDALPGWLRGERPSTPQDPEHVTLARMLAKTDAALDFTRSAQAVHDWARGMNPWPGAEAQLEGERLKIHRTLVIEQEGVHGAPGTVLHAQASTAEGPAMVIACGQGTLGLLEVQLPGKRRMKPNELAAGRPIAAGTILTRPTQESAAEPT